MNEVFFGAVLKYTGPTPKIAKRVLNAIQKHSFETALEYWHEHFRDKHFTLEGAQEYQYTPRVGDRGSGRRFKGSYTARKLKKFHHARPLEYTGLSRHLAREKSIKATGKGGRARIKAPALNFKHPKSKINMRDEMTRVSPAERKLIAEVFDATMHRALQNPQQFTPEPAEKT